MKKKITVVVISLMFALFIMSGGYGLWSEELDIVVDIDVLPDPAVVAETRAQLLEVFLLQLQQKNENNAEADSNEEGIEDSETDILESGDETGEVLDDGTGTIDPENNETGMENPETDIESEQDEEDTEESDDSLPVEEPIEEEGVEREYDTEDSIEEEVGPEDDTEDSIEEEVEPEDDTEDSIEEEVEPEDDTEDSVEEEVTTEDDTGDLEEEPIDEIISNPEDNN